MLQQSAVTRNGGVWLWAALIAATPVWGAELNALRDIQVAPTHSGVQVVVLGSKAPTFTVFRLNDPDRLVVDLSSADASAVQGPHDGQGPVSGVVASQFSDERASVGRILVALDHAAQYDVRADGNRLLISVSDKDKVAVLDKVAPAPEAALGKDPAVAPPPESGSKGNVVANKLDEREVKHPARRITALKLSKDNLEVFADGQVAKYELIELSDPPRLALDVYGVSLATRTPSAHGGPIKQVRAGPYADKVRLVMDIDGPMPAYRMARRPQGLMLVLGETPERSSPVAREASSKAESGPAEAEIDGKKVGLSEVSPLGVKSEPTAVEVQDVDFKEGLHGGRLEIRLSALTQWKVERPDRRGAVLILERARLPKRLERSLDTSALDTPIKMISTFSQPGADRVRIVAAASEAFEESLKPTPEGLVWQFTSKGVRTQEVAVSPKTAPATTDAEPEAAAPEPSAPSAPRSRYAGKRVSFEFKDIDIHNLLRVIAEVSKKNVVVADDVSGKVTIRLRNVPWDQALELILRSKGLGKEELGNIIRVAPLKTLEEEAKLREERKKSLVAQEELVVQLIPVNYATASQLAERVKDVLSTRGNVTVDARTNVLIVRDIQSNIGRARSLVLNLDTQTPQVLIESRIVEANTSYSRQLGVQWGGAGQLAPGTGNATGLAFPNTVAVTGGSTNDSNAGTATNPNFAVNLPAAIGTGSGGALGFVFGSIGGAVSLNLRLSALETTGSVKTISAPKVTTLDHNTAKISQGVSIPFSQVSAQGVNTTFVEARLSLEVTPHITQDGSILMAIKAENNQPDPSNTGANGQPAIQRKEANTQVMVKDGDTTVIGGIYVRRGSTSVAGVPFFSKIPILGWLFHDSREADSRQELLIFITPRIINRQTIAQTL